MYKIPEIKRLISPLSTQQSHHPHTPISYYRIRTDKTPPQNELFNLCIITDDNQAFLKMFETYSNSHMFVAPKMDNISSIMIAPTEYEWNMKYIDMEIQSRNEKDEISETRMIHFIPYYGAIDTNCLFVPETEKTAEQIREITEQGNKAYAKQKQTTNMYTIGFLVSGSSLFQVTSGSHSAFAFIVGCTIGIIYQLLLQYEVDRLGKHMMFVNSATRLAIICALGAIIANNTDEIVPADIWIASSGFLMQKIALWLAFMV